MAPKKRPKTWRNLAIVVAAVLIIGTGAAALVALNDQDEKTAPDLTPTASLDAPDQRAFRGDTLVFDGRGSTDPNGELIGYRFDFGDGTVIEVGDAEDARVFHSYQEGGLYEVVLTVMDDGAGQNVALLDKASVVVAVSERHETEGQVSHVGQPDTEPMADTSQWTMDVDVFDGAGSYGWDLTAQNTAPFGSTDILVEIIDGDGEVIYAQEVQLEPDGTEKATIDGEFEEAGPHTLRISTQSGSASFNGTFLALAQR